MSSGVGIADECVEVFNQLVNNRYLYVTFRLNDEMTTIVPDQVGGLDKTFDEFVSVMKKAESNRQCRFGVVDIRLIQPTAPGSKIAFISWSPEGAAVLQKMVYSSSKDILRRRLLNVDREVQCTEDSDLTMANILERLYR